MVASEMIICERCENPIATEYYYSHNGEYFCEDCIDDVLDDYKEEIQYSTPDEDLDAAEAFYAKERF